MNAATAGPRNIDLVCWDFGDTLVDEQFMRIAPPGVAEWSAVYNGVLDERPDWVDELNLGLVQLHDLIPVLTERLPMTAVQVSAHLRTVWRRIEWFSDSLTMVKRLEHAVTQAIVTVNPHEFHGIATCCGLDELVPTMITSADTQSMSKVVMANRVRELLGMEPGLSSTVLVDNKVDNIDEFIAAGGAAVLYERDANSLDELAQLLGLEAQ